MHNELQENNENLKPLLNFFEVNHKGWENDIPNRTYGACCLYSALLKF